MFRVVNFRGGKTVRQSAAMSDPEAQYLFLSGSLGVL